MNYKNAMMGIINGETPDGMVFVPRLDIWYNANRRRRTMPPGYEGLSLEETVSKLGAGFHSVIPDYIHNGPEEDLYHRGIGFYNNREYVYEADFSNVDYTVEKTEKEIVTTYYCTHGEIRTKFYYNRDVLNSGVTLPAVSEHAVKSHDDYPRLREIYEKVKILPRPERFVRYRDRIGDRGLPVVYLSIACGPMQHILRDLRDYQSFVYDLYDVPGLMAELSEPLGVLYGDMLAAFTASEGEVGFFGGNYDDTLTPRPFFDEHILPWLKKGAALFHEAGKFLLTHTDGENSELNGSYLKCDFDVADSVCPSPMTKLTLEEYRSIYGEQMTIWGGIPSVITLKTSCSYDDFKEYVDRIFESCKPYNKLILGIADTTPADADFGRIEYIRDKSL
jgi:hypothetical protein